MKTMATTLRMTLGTALALCLCLPSVAREPDGQREPDARNEGSDPNAEFVACIQGDQRWSGCYHHLGLFVNANGDDENPYASLFEEASKEPSSRWLGPWNPTSIDILRGSRTE